MGEKERDAVTDMLEPRLHLVHFPHTSASTDGTTDRW